MEIKEIDRKILTYINHNRNPSIAKIAKTLRISRDQVDYRIKKYLSDGFIKKFMTFFNYPSLGYNYFAAIFLKFEKLSQAEKFFKHLDKNRNVISYGRCLAKYDIYLNAIFKNENELSEFLSEILSDNESTISDYLIMKPYLSEFYPLKFINSHQTEENMFSPTEQKDLKKFDEKDIKIMKMLDKNGWEKITNIAHEIKSSPELVIYKIKRLEREKVILGTRIYFDYFSIGYFPTLLLVNMPNFSEANKNKLKRFVKESPRINNFLLSFSKPNCIIQIFHKNENELREEIKKLQDLFKDDIISIEILPLEEEINLPNMLPFL